MTRTLVRWLARAAAVAMLVSALPAVAEEKVLLDFEDDADLQSWSVTDLDALHEAAAKPPVKLELSTEHATSGKHCLKLTFAGGELPTVGTDKVALDDWSPYKTFRAEVYASRVCVVVFRVLREKSRRGDGWDDQVSRYEKVARLDPGKNEVVELTHVNAEGLARSGKVVRVEISMYAPRPGESIWVDNVRLCTELPQATTPYSYMNVHYMGEVRAEAPFFPRLDRKIKVLGTDWELSAVPEVGHRLKDQWIKPEKKTVDQIEAEFREDYETLKKTHPRAAMTIFRDGQKGYDPADPEKVYAGWRNTELQGHDPGAVYAGQLGKRPGKSNPNTEFFLRRRTCLMKADLSSIPPGSKILLARFMVVKTASPDPERLKGEYAWESPLKPTYFVAEACNRDWDEAVANGIEYAEGKFWKEICGEFWSGDDPDFLPLVIAYGQAGHDQNVFNFTQAVKYWTEGQNANHGFTMYSFSPYMEFCNVWTRHVEDVKKRPALMVVYVPD